MTKSYQEMTPAERLADRIAKNREIEQRVAANKAAPSKPAAVASRQKAVRSVLDKFHEIKKTQGIDAASDFVRSRKDT